MSPQVRRQNSCFKWDRILKDLVILCIFLKFQGDIWFNSTLFIYVFNQASNLTKNWKNIFSSLTSRVRPSCKHLPCWKHLSPLIIRWKIQIMSNYTSSVYIYYKDSKNNHNSITKDTYIYIYIFKQWFYYNCLSNRLIQSHVKTTRQSHTFQKSEAFDQVNILEWHSFPWKNKHYWDSSCISLSSTLVT